MQNINKSGLSQLKTKREQTVETVCNLTGLPKNVVNDMYPNLSNNFFGDLSDGDIIKHYEDLMKAEENKHKTNQEILDKLVNYQIDDLLSEAGTNDYLVKLNALQDSNAKLTLTTELIEKINPLKNKPTIQSFDFKPLFEGLQSTLVKSFNKTGFTNVNIQSNFNLLMDYLNNEIEKETIRKSMETTDGSMHLRLIESFLSGHVNPIYRDMSSVKHLISDKQTLIFDMLLIVDNFFNSKEYDLSFVKKKNFTEYQNISNELLSSISSSVYSSKILNSEILELLKHSKSNFIKTCTSAIQHANFEGMNLDLYLVSFKSIMDILKFIHSSNIEFNLKIRKLINVYVSKSIELLNNTENARLVRIKAGY